LIEKYVSAVANLDYGAMDELLDDNYVGFGPSHNDSVTKERALSNWKNNVENLYKSISFSRSRNLASFVPDGPNAGNWVSNWSEMTIVYKKDEKQVTLWVNTIYKIDDNKIIRSYTFYNEADVLEQLGYVFIDPNEL
jgi:hypothetical protein